MLLFAMMMRVIGYFPFLHTALVPFYQVSAILAYLLLGFHLL